MKYKYIGILNTAVAEKWNLIEHKNKPILVFDDRIQHVIDKHLKDFETVENIMIVYNNLSNIIKKPDYTFFNSKTSGLEYYKKLDNICVAVRISNGKVLKVRSWYPPNKGKISNRQKKEKILYIKQ